MSMKRMNGGSPGEIYICRHCGSSDHNFTDDRCTAKDVPCGVCHQIGHYSRMCFKPMNTAAQQRCDENQKSHKRPSENSSEASSKRPKKDPSIDPTPLVLVPEAEKIYDCLIGNRPSRFKIGKTNPVNIIMKLVASKSHLKTNDVLQLQYGSNMTFNGVFAARLKLSNVNSQYVNFFICEGDEEFVLITKELAEKLDIKHYNVKRLASSSSSKSDSKHFRSHDFNRGRRSAERSRDDRKRSPQERRRHDDSRDSRRDGDRRDNRDNDRRKRSNSRERKPFDNRRGGGFKQRRLNDRHEDDGNHEGERPDMKQDPDEAPLEKDSFSLSGKLTEETIKVQGIIKKYAEPPEAMVPRRRWRLHPFKGESGLPTLRIHRTSAFLIGRDRKICDIAVDHPSCSKQHAALQYRLVPYEREDGFTGKRVRPFIIDLESVNGTFVNKKKIDPKKYVELFEKDDIKFGLGTSYLLLHDASKDEAEDDEVADDPPFAAAVADNGINWTQMLHNFNELSDLWRSSKRI